MSGGYWRNEAAPIIAAARELLQEIVCTEGEDRGVILLDHEGRSEYDEELKCHVYQCENFSPLGDALIERPI